MESSEASLADRLSLRIGSLRQNKFVRATTQLAAGTLFAQIVVIAATPLMTRIYRPEDLGEFGIFLAYASVISVAATLRYETAIVSAESEQEASLLFFISLLSAAPVALVAFGVVKLLDFSSKLTYRGDFTLFGLLLLPYLLAVGVATGARYWLLRGGNVRDISKMALGQGIGRVGLQLSFGLVHPGPASLIGGETLGRLVGVLPALRKHFAAFRRVVHETHGRDYLAAAKKFKKFPQYSLLSSLLDVTAVSLPLPMIGYYFGVAPAGYFALAQRVFAAPIQLVGGSVADVFHSRIAELVRNREGGGTRLFLKTAGVLAIIGTLIALTLVLIGERLFGLVFGANWAMAGKLAAAISPWAVGQLVVGPLTRIVFVYQSLRLKLIYDSISLGLVVLVVPYAVHHGADSFKTISYLSLANLFAYGVYFLILLKIVRKGAVA